MIVFRPICWIIGHRLKPDPQNPVLQGSYYDCVRCGKVTDHSLHAEKVLSWDCWQCDFNTGPKEFGEQMRHLSHVHDEKFPVPVTNGRDTWVEYRGLEADA